MEHLVRFFLLAEPFEDDGRVDHGFRPASLHFLISPAPLQSGVRDSSLSFLIFSAASNIRFRRTLSSNGFRDLGRVHSWDTLDSFLQEL